MKTIFSMIAVGCVMTGAALAADAGQKLIDTENAWAKAYPVKDVAVIGSFLGDDWVAQDDSGKPEGKAAFLADIKSGKLVFTSIKLHDMKARVFGNVGIAQGMDDEKSTWAGKDISGTYSWIDVFELRNGKWVAVASQLTKVAK